VNDSVHLAASGCVWERRPEVLLESLLAEVSSVFPHVGEQRAGLPVGELVKEDTLGALGMLGPYRDTHHEDNNDA
jgi:hypothetical protein